MNILVLGVGSILMMDEGIGVRAAEELKRRFRFPEDVEIVDGGTSGIELLSFISGRDYMILIDAITSGNPPGTVLRVEGEDVPARFRQRISPHQIGLSDLLAAAALTDEMPKKLVLFGIEPKEIKMGIGFSDEVKSSFERLIQVVLSELRSLGVSPEEIENPEYQPESIWGKI